MTTTRTAACSCGQLTVTCEGEPVRISMCHCLACQRRSGSLFAVQARWPVERVSITGRATEWRVFADPTFPQPTVGVYLGRRHPWAVMPGLHLAEEYE